MRTTNHKQKSRKVSADAKLKSESKIGSFAVCQKGELGLVLWQHNCIDKRSKKAYILYHGINLMQGKKFGSNWQSRNPNFLTKNQFVKLWKERKLKNEQ
jgi:FKBP-type peptidyl-prolyl cis-trans isomerase